MHLLFSGSDPDYDIGVCSAVALPLLLAVNLALRVTFDTGNGIDSDSVIESDGDIDTVSGISSAVILNRSA